MGSVITFNTRVNPWGLIRPVDESFFEAAGRLTANSVTLHFRAKAPAVAAMPRGPSQRMPAFP